VLKPRVVPESEDDSDDDTLQVATVPVPSSELRSTVKNVPAPKRIYRRDGVVPRSADAGSNGDDSSNEVDTDDEGREHTGHVDMEADANLGNDDDEGTNGTGTIGVDGDFVADGNHPDTPPVSGEEDEDVTRTASPERRRRGRTQPGSTASASGKKRASRAIGQFPAEMQAKVQLTASLFEARVAAKAAYEVTDHLVPAWKQATREVEGANIKAGPIPMDVESYVSACCPLRTRHSTSHA
jgi:hypothetical protein